MSSLAFETVSSSAIFCFVFFCFAFLLSAGNISWIVLFFFRRKLLWQRIPAHCHSLHLPHINEPSLHVHYILPPRQMCQKRQPCEGIDKVLLKGPKFKVQFWKTKKGSLIGDVQRLIFFMISHARNWLTIKIYSDWLKGPHFCRHLCIFNFHIVKVHDTKN